MDTTNDSGMQNLETEITIEIESDSDNNYSPPSNHNLHTLNQTNIVIDV